MKSTPEFQDFTYLKQQEENNYKKVHRLFPFLWKTEKLKDTIKNPTHNKYEMKVWKPHIRFK